MKRILRLFTTKYVARALLSVLLLDGVLYMIDIKPNIGSRAAASAIEEGSKGRQIYARYANAEKVKNVGRAAMALW